jgi:hypothetical protein
MEKRAIVRLNFTWIFYALSILTSILRREILTEMRAISPFIALITKKTNYGKTKDNRCFFKSLRPSYAI